MLLGVPDADDADVSNIRVANEFGFELGGGDLKSLYRRSRLAPECSWLTGKQGFDDIQRLLLARRKRVMDDVSCLTVFDELFHAIGDVKIAVRVDVKDITGFVPAVLGEGLLIQIRLLPVTLEDVGSLQEQFTRLWNEVSIRTSSHASGIQFRGRPVRGAFWGRKERDVLHQEAVPCRRFRRSWPPYWAVTGRRSPESATTHPGIAYGQWGSSPIDRNPA